VLGQEWLVLDVACDWRQYENGSVFVCTAPPGTYQARWRGQYIQTEPQLVGKTEWRVYTITIRGPPVTEPAPTDPDTSPDPTPLPPGKRLVAVIYESSTTVLPPQLHNAVAKLREAGTQVRVIDRDVTTGTGQVPREVAPLIEAARTVQSSVVLGISSGGRVRAVPCPTSEAEILAEVAK